MPSYSMRFKIPTELTEPMARKRFFWTPGTDADSFRSTFGPQLGGLGPVPEPNVELVRLAAMVYAADRSSLRRGGGSNWSSRELAIEIPVSDASRWEPVSEQLQSLLGFLSGDSWTLTFRNVLAPKEQLRADQFVDARRVVLLSGGADSAVGALLSRRDLADEQHVLVSHFAATNLPTIQRDIARRVGELLPGPAQLHQQIRFSRAKAQPNGTAFPSEVSTRTRSFLFLALGLAVASIHRMPLWIPENGFASLNPPLAADQRGSLSTRTTHPLFLQQVSLIATSAGAHADIENPFSKVTKGEMFSRVAELLGTDAASEFLSATHSCAHTGHRTYGYAVNEQCGVCFGCLLRRASFRVSGVPDLTAYLSDLTSDRPDAYLRSKSMERPLRAFITRGMRPSDYATLSLPPGYGGIAVARDICDRAIEELGTLFS